MGKTMKPAITTTALCLWWVVVTCLTIHSTDGANEVVGAKEVSTTTLRDSMTVDGKVDNMEVQGEPIISRSTDDWDEPRCLTYKGSAKACEPDSATQLWIYKRLHGGTLTTLDGSKCLTRKGSVITVEKCNGGSTQKWQRLCGAWANGNGQSGRVLSFEGKASEPESKVRAAQWTGDTKQLWHFEEKVTHSECSKKEYKVLSFDGTVKKTVAVNAFLSMPSKELTVAMWVKGSAGTPFSYASKNHVNAFVMKDLKDLKVYVKDQEIKTYVDMTSSTWVHLAVTWSSKMGELKVFRNGKKVFTAQKVQKGKGITPGGCAWFGQHQKTVCKTHVAADAYKGQMIDMQVWKQVHTEEGIEKMMSHPVDQEILAKIGKMTTVKTPKNQRVAFLSRQYSGEEMTQPNPPVCKMDAFKKKDVPKLKKVAGNMPRLSGTGDVHYSNYFKGAFNGCKFDDQSVGEWVMTQTKAEYYTASPLSIQYRTSPSRTNCPWCQNGAVAYIDGCAIKYGDEQASAGFGGYGFPGYTPYAAMNGVRLNGHRRGKNLNIVASNHRFKAEVISEGIVLDCHKAAIYITMPNTFKGKIEGIGGTGMGKNHDWMMGPNVKAYPAAKAGRPMPGLQGACHRGYQYPMRESPFNGNRADKPLVKFFKSWQVDGNHIPSAFYYNGNTGPGSFNRIAGQKVKPISGTNDRPTGKKAAAMKMCKLLRSTPKARTKCVFDFMIMGMGAIKASQKDRERQRSSKVFVPDVRAVRDMTRYRGDAMWAGQPGWECGDEFRKMQILKAKQHEELWATRKSSKRQMDAEKAASCPAGLVVVAEQLDIHPQETKKCSAGMAALSIKEEGKAAAKAGKKKIASKKKAPTFWEMLAAPTQACTQAYVESCTGLGCVKFSAAELGESETADKKDLKAQAKEVKAKAEEKRFVSSSGHALFLSGRSVNKAHDAAQHAKDQKKKKSGLELTELFQLGEDEKLENKQVADENSEARSRESKCIDNNKDKALGCDKLKGACRTELVQAACAATCGTPWAGDSNCKAFADKEQQYQCQPTSVCTLKSTKPSVPEGYKWLAIPEVNSMSPGSKCSPETGFGVAVCDSGKRAKISFKQGKKTVEEEVACGCDGGYRIVTHSKSCVDAGCTPAAQLSRKNQTDVLKAAYDQYEERSVKWSEACNSIDASSSAFSASLGELQTLKASATKVNFFSSPWKFQSLHLQSLYKESEDHVCKAQFRWGMSVCDTGPMREAVFFVPKRGYEIYKVGCGCQQMRVQASFNGKLIKMKDQKKATQSKCIAKFMKWNTEFYQGIFASYYDQAQKISDEIERQCARSSLELTNVATEEVRAERLKKLIVEQNSAHLAKLSENNYATHLKSVKETQSLGKCKTRKIIRSGISSYERKSKELAKTQDKKKANGLRNQLVKLKAQLDKHERSIGPALR